MRASKSKSTHALAVGVPLFLLLFAALPGCGSCGATHFDQVPLTGLLSCPPKGKSTSRWLVHPIVVDLTDSGTHLRRVFNGWSGQTRPRTMSLPDADHNYTARFGQCSRTPGVRFRCVKVAWFATRTVDIDPTASGASILVPAAPSSACEDATSRRDR